MTTFDLVVMRRLRGDSGIGHGDVTQVELLRPGENGQFPDDLVEMEDSQIHCVTSQTY